MSRRLVVNDGRRERELALVDKIVVGRDPACDLVYDNVLLSRQDAVFTVEGDRVLVRDLGSRIGVFVNGLRSSERVLDPGDVVQIGPLRIRYAQDRPVAAPPIEPAIAEAIMPPSLRPARPLPPLEADDRRDADFETRYPRAVAAFPERTRAAAATPPADMDAIADDWSFPFEAPPMTSATLRSAAAAPAPVFTASVPPAPAAIAAVPLGAPVAARESRAAVTRVAAAAPASPAASASASAPASTSAASVASPSIAARAPAPASRIPSIAPSILAEPPAGSPLASFRPEESSFSLSRAMRRDLEADMRTYVLIQVGAVAAIVWLSSLVPLVVGLRMMGVDMMALDTRLAPWVAVPFVVAIAATYMFGGFITRRFFRLIRAMKLDWPPSDRNR